MTKAPALELKIIFKLITSIQKGLFLIDFLFIFPFFLFFFVELFAFSGKKLQCPLCDRQYGYETNLRAHIRQRHQGIRVPCPFCSRTFTRNNTVRRHIAREHKHQQIVQPFQS